MSVTRRYRGSHELLPIPSLEQWIDPTEAIITITSSNALTVNSGSSNGCDSNSGSISGSGSSCSSSSSSNSISKSSSEKSNGGSCSNSNSHDNNSATPIKRDKGKDKVRKKSSTVTMESGDARKNTDKSISNILDDIATKLNVDSADLIQQAEKELENAGYYCRPYS